MVTSGVGGSFLWEGLLLRAQTQAPPTCWAEFSTVPLQIQDDPFQVNVCLV